MIRKTHLLLLLLCFCSYSAIYAGSKPKVDSAWEQMKGADKHRFLIGVGVGAYSSDIMKSFNVFHISETIQKPLPVFSGSVKYFLGKDVAISATYSYESNTYTSEVKQYYFVRSITSKYNARVAAIECTYVYDRIYKTTLALYTTVSVGRCHVFGKIDTRDDEVAGNSIYNTTYRSENFDIAKTKGHLTFIGIRGGKKICWYAEGGYGFKGLVNAGVAVKL